MNNADADDNRIEDDHRPNIWGAGPIGRVIGRTARQTHHMLSSGLIKSAKKIGGRWTANPVALRREFGG